MLFSRPKGFGKDDGGDDERLQGFTIYFRFIVLYTAPWDNVCCDFAQCK